MDNVKRPGFAQQLNILLARNVEIQLGSFGTLMILLCQAPLIGWFIGLGWRREEPVLQTYFVMAVAAVWMGCMNASCAIVRERAVLERERMFNLNLWSYLISKLITLSLISGVQTILLLVVQGQMMHLHQDTMNHILYFLVLTGSGITAASLGLAISAFARTSYAATITVPILLIPQVIFSKAILRDNIDNNIPSKIEFCTITKWSYEAISAIQDEVEWGDMFKSAAMLTVGVLVFMSIAAARLKLDDQ